MTWRRSGAAPPPSCGTAGFTLIEIVVVLAVVGFALAVVVGYKPPWSKGLDLEATAAELASQLRLARSQAIAGNRPVALDLDLVGKHYRVDDGALHALPVGTEVELLTIGGERQGNAIGGIRFQPDGSSSGGRIVLADHARRVAVGVDWLTGRVAVSHVR